MKHYNIIFLRNLFGFLAELVEIILINGKSYRMRELFEKMENSKINSKEG